MIKVMMQTYAVAPLNDCNSHEQARFMGFASPVPANVVGHGLATKSDYPIM
jgi:hypothetical protein